MTDEIEPIYARIADKIVAGRKFFGFTQGDIAKAAGLSRPALANIEAKRQRISIHQIDSICGTMGIDPSVLMRGVWSTSAFRE